MSYATGTINSATPAKDLMAAIQPTLTAGGLTLVESYQTPVAANWTISAYGAGLFVTAATNTTTVATSPDGVTWTQRTLPVSSSWQALAYGAGTFLLVGTGGNYCVSPDGINWTYKTGLPALSFVAVTYGGGQFVMLANASNVVMTSPDGTNWTQRTHTAGALGWYGMTYGNGMYVATVAGSTSGASSPDGFTWTVRNFFNSQSWLSVAYGNGTFVSMAVNGTTNYVTSPDGINWTNKTIAAAPTIRAITYGGGQFVAVGVANQIYTSPDALIWTGRAATNAVATSVVYGGGVFTAPTSPGTVTNTSPDGTNWTNRQLPPTSVNPMADVYRSPAGSNVAGQDWYLILRRANDTAAALFYQVAETYDPVSHLIKNYGGLGLAAIPTSAATGYANPAAAVAPDAAAAFAAQASLAVTASTAVPFYVSATADRVMLGGKNPAEFGLYAGLYEDLLPAAVTGFPLVCAKLPTAQTGATAIGGGSNPTTGGFTREPGQTVSATGNFEAAVWNGWLYSANTAAAFNSLAFAMVTDAAALYGNSNSLARVPIGSTRSATANTANAVRGLLIGAVYSTAVSLIGDTIASGAKTYVRFCGPVTSFGVFADSGL